MRCRRGEAWYGHRLEPELRRNGHDVVAVDLPADDDSAGLEEYARVVVDAAETLPGDAGPLVLVAQSMGAFTAPLVCQHVPVDLMVLVAAMSPATGEAPGDWWSNTGQIEAQRAMAEREGRPTDGEFDPVALFLHDLPEEVQAEALRNPPRDQSGTPFARPWPLDRWPDVPTRFVLARDDRLFPAEFQRRIVPERLGIVPDEIDGGHLVALSRPVELADRLDAYVRVPSS
ncbi:MAG TPA: alpha/beta hydrolase [Actinopolymorphaceae bacterium]